MATKAELEEELTQLRKQMAEHDETTASDAASKPDDEADSVQTVFSDLLAGHGVEATEISALWTQFTGELSSELDGLPEKKPLLTAALAFGLGFVLGRISK